MKAIKAYWLCKRKKIITGSLSFKEFKLMKFILYPGRSWEWFVKHLMMAIYITNVPNEPIIVPEVQFAVGGEIMAVMDGKRISTVSYGKVGENDLIEGNDYIGG